MWVSLGDRSPGGLGDPVACLHQMLFSIFTFSVGEVSRLGNSDSNRRRCRGEVPGLCGLLSFGEVVPPGLGDFHPFGDNFDARSSSLARVDGNCDKYP